MTLPTEQDFFDNTWLRQNKHTYRLSCRRGLWAVEARDLRDVVKEAWYYFAQYWQDGEYTEPTP